MTSRTMFAVAMIALTASACGYLPGQDRASNAATTVVDDTAIAGDGVDAPSLAVTVDVTTEAEPGAVPVSLSEVEAELGALINELRQEPAGRLAGDPLAAECGDFFRIELEADSGHPTPAPPLTLHEALSVDVARAWSQQMADQAELSHQSLPAVGETARGLGLGGVWAENVAYVGRNDDPAVVAMGLFEAWRDSKDHYCAMVGRNITVIGIGVVDDGERVYGTLNFAT